MPDKTHFPRTAQLGQFVPEPIIFTVSAFISALAVIPLFFLKGGNQHQASNEY